MAHETDKARWSRFVAPVHANAGPAPPQKNSDAPTGLVRPAKDKAPRLAGTEGIRGQDQNEQADCAATPVTDQERKRFTALAALAARSGIELHELAGGYLLCRWGHCLELADLPAVALLLGQMGVRR